MQELFSLFDNRQLLVEQWNGKRVIGILGITPSASKVQNSAWNYMLNKYDLNTQYLPFDFSNKHLDQLDRVKSVIQSAQSCDNLIGLKIAPPYKENIYQLLNEFATDAAKRIGVINSASYTNGKWRCINTDGFGMYHNMTETFGDLKNKTFLILGSGGAASTISDCLALTAKKIVIASRKIGNAKNLKKLLEREHSRCVVKVISLEDIQENIDTIDIVINTTPVGRQGQFGSYSALASTDLASEKNVDISNAIINSINKKICFASTLYVPEKEIMLQQAERSGHIIKNGLGMWIYQAVVATRDLFFPQELQSVTLSQIADTFRTGIQTSENS